MLPLLASSECFALRAEHNGKFLQSVHHPEHGGSRVEASADTTAGDARARFFLEPSKEHQGLVHIRYCHNNAYWVLVRDGNNDDRRYMSAADEPHEDLSSESCTLFEPVPVESKENNIRLRVPQSGPHGGYASIIPVFDKSKPYLQFHLTAESSFTVIGLSRKNQLPTLIALKSDNGWYLQHVGTWLKFDTHDIKNEGVAFSVHTNDDGTVLIMTDKGGFWSRRSSDWVSTDGTLANKKDQNPDMVFKVITGDGLIALQNMGNHKFCNRLNYEGISYLSASADRKNKWAWFVLEEPIIRREIFDFVFHLNEARIYNKEIISVDTHQHTNYTSSDQTGTFSFTMKKEVVTTWETVVSFSSTIDKMFASQVTKIPTIVDGEIKLSHKPEGDSEEIIVTQSYIVPPGKTVTAKFVTMHASCDVPYSYSQKDVLTNGEEITTFHEDGIYTVVNTYNLPITVTDPEDKVI